MAPALPGWGGHAFNYGLNWELRISRAIFIPCGEKYVEEVVKARRSFQLATMRALEMGHCHLLSVGMLLNDQPLWGTTWDAS